MADASVADGAGAIMGHYPNDPFAGPTQKIEYFLRLADHVAVPVVAYLRSDEATIADLVRLSAHDNIAAVKFAAPNPLKLAEAIRSTAQHDTVWVCGLAEGWAPSFYAAGARGFTSGLVNVFPEISLAIWSALEAGDYPAAREQINRIVDFEDMRTLSTTVPMSPW
ncbi:dihydrodipicolinate synthase family protein [Marinovum sp. 2_MG-2023]|uniref:dihydrodipicolinate synthase family protein n=1 Tax=unclassified Marinovum TaxID=2647166 RepID=UPI0026E2FCA2|nr:MULTISPECIES: dihydrodipicolinate synthase family protein [unclassified Marinovum]MDO6732825.1 dihydrodipicolinate synthase family protein [Marinovum sp. 2_MG-2023]MDO6782097.1 dihydrodipicolinate synthase family protein [Marinovum sp. 1_MG-2023]